MLCHGGIQQLLLRAALSVPAGPCGMPSDLVVARLVLENRSSKIICLVRQAGEGLRS